MNYLIKDIAEKLKAARKEKGLLQREVAEKMGTIDRNIRRIESGTWNITPETIVKYCDAIGVRAELIIK